MGQGFQICEKHFVETFNASEETCDALSRSVGQLDRK